jgi:hypothetical protein
MLNFHSELYYDLTTPVYYDSVRTTVYLNPVNSSSMLPYPVVKRTGGAVVPLLLFNYIQDRYTVSLGEVSFIQPYYEFLTDALTAQSNRSACFNLVVMNEGDVLSDSAFILEVEVNKNVTNTRMVSTSYLVFIPTFEDHSFSDTNWEIKQPVSHLVISVRLMQQGKSLWEKTYDVMQDLPYTRRGIKQSSTAYQACIDHLTECLSYATKEIAENISRDLHLLILAKQARDSLPPG